jgi:cyclase
MEMLEVEAGIIAFIRPQEGANASLIRTADGAVVIDTTSSASDMRKLLDTAQADPSEVRLVINTHSHSDHTWGNQLFECPILAHQLCRDTMAANLEGPWDIQAMRQSIAERGKTEPQWANEMQEKVRGLQITLPTETFADRLELEQGGVQIELIHVDAHTPGSAVVWLPQSKTLFSGDLLFVGRYPFIGDADIPALIDVLQRLPEFGAEAIVPGHGHLCAEKEIAGLVDYLSTTWSRTAGHVAQGHTIDQATSDPGYPRYAEQGAERYHETNIRIMYERLLAR